MLLVALIPALAEAADWTFWWTQRSMINARRAFLRLKTAEAIHNTLSFAGEKMSINKIIFNAERAIPKIWVITQGSILNKAVPHAAAFYMPKDSPWYSKIVIPGNWMHIGNDPRPSDVVHELLHASHDHFNGPSGTLDDEGIAYAFEAAYDFAKWFLDLEKRNFFAIQSKENLERVWQSAWEDMHTRQVFYKESITYVENRHYQLLEKLHGATISCKSIAEAYNSIMNETRTDCIKFICEPQGKNQKEIGTGRLLYDCLK
jgi:hypothetical protein